jgi:hypothetical protein
MRASATANTRKWLANDARQFPAKVASKTADNPFMGSISLSSPLLQSVLSTAIKSIGLIGGTTPASTSSISASSAAGQPDSSQLSPFAQLMNTLQQLQQSDPSKFAKVTQQIATNLQGAAQTATAGGNTAAASQLNQLATDFSSASTSGQLPNVADLAKAIGGHHHHASTASPAAASSNSPSQALSALFSTLESSSSQSASTDPMSIITSTLSNAGVTS